MLAEHSMLSPLSAAVLALYYKSLWRRGIRSGTPIDLGGNFLEVLQSTSGGSADLSLFNTATRPTG